MCGRYVLLPGDVPLEEIFNVANPDPGSVDRLIARFNIAPSQAILAIVADAEGKRRMGFLEWGLVPAWAKDPKTVNRSINARAETLTEKPSFRAAFRKRRCLIPASGFYEWKRNGKSKTPMFIKLKSGEPFAFAGLYEIWKASAGGETIKSCTIITTTPNTLMAEIHDRMPAIVQPADYDRWLAHDDSEPLELLKPYDPEAMIAYEVSTRVNGSQLDEPGLIEPV